MLRYFQVGGFRPQIKVHSRSFPYDDKELAEALAGHGRVELALGIKTSGSSHLLLNEEQVEEFARRRAIIRPDPRHAFILHDFESISPIYFDSAQELQKKLSTLKPKATKNARAQQRDTSQANRKYEENDGRPSLRCQYEHGRVLYHILGNTINMTNYGIGDTFWTSHLTVKAFVFNPKRVDDRKFVERTRNPIVVDVGLCDAVFPSLDPNPATARHILNKQNSTLNGRRHPFEYGETETRDPLELSRYMQDVFKDCEQPTPSPMILLVYSQEITLNFLENLGVDVSNWSFGLKDLLYGGKNTYNASRQQPHPSSHRARSRSPHGQSGSDYASSTSVRRDRYPPVYVVDLEQLYNTLMEEPIGPPLVDIAARFLDIPRAAGQCAGNEAALALRLWKSMISQLPIDEQNQVISGRFLGKSFDGAPDGTPTSGPSRSSTQAPMPFSFDSDDDEDPNAFADSRVPTGKPASMGKEKIGYNFDESDEGDSDDDSD